MVLLYKDPDGETVFEKSHVGSSMDRKAGMKVTTFKADSDPESKVTSLQRMLKEKDETIVQLRDEIETIKVLIQHTCRDYSVTVSVQLHGILN